MIKTIAILTSGLAVAFAAVPGSAASTNTTTEAAMAASASESTAQAAPTKKRYCVVQEVTGSRMPVKTCKSKEEWEALGVELPNK
jgi:hypothetical protein